MEDHALIEKMAVFNRERSPERVVHAKGAGAYGTLTITRDITQYTRAKIFSEVGKKQTALYAFPLSTAKAVRMTRHAILAAFR